MRLLIVIAILLFSSIGYACEHLPLGVPKQSDFVKCRVGYAIGYSYELKSAEWVSYILKGTEQDGVERTDAFEADPDIPIRFQTYPADYDEPKYDQGHLANSESIDTSSIANLETFYMSNMTPQLPTHNRAIWKGLENRERKWALQRDLVLVMAGPLYLSEPIEVIGSNNVPVPTNYWKVVYDMQTGEAISFLIDHKPLKTSALNDYLSSIDEIEEASGLDLLGNLPDGIENNIESVQLSSQW